MSFCYYNSKDYGPYKIDRKKGTKGTLMLFPGEDITKESKLHMERNE